jgi:hypothetical protein
MKAVVGVFKSRRDAERGLAELAPLEIPKEKINTLTPEVTDKEIAAVPVVPGEQAGVATAMGAVVGGAMGVAGGASLAPAIASWLIPGLGMVLGTGMIAGTLLGAIGALAGSSVGTALEDRVFEGLPEDELFVYQDALRNGRTVVVVMAEDNDANAIRGALELGGAETIDRAREMWWLGLRDVEKEKYLADGADFDRDERNFRAGFEAALQLRNRNRSNQECYEDLADRDLRAYESQAFLRGFERGREYLQAFRKRAAKTSS